MMEFEAKKIAEKIDETGITHSELTLLFKDLNITTDIPDDKKRRIQAKSICFIKKTKNYKCIAH